MRLSFKEALARPAEEADDSRSKSASPVDLLLRAEGDIDRPVDVARMLTSVGVALRKAHDVLTRVAAGETVAVTIYAPDADRLRADLAGLGLSARIIRRPVVDVRSVRQRLKLSQAEFAIRFGFELDTIQNWEQGRNSPDAPTQTLLRLIETHPEIVEEALAGPVQP